MPNDSSTSTGWPVSERDLRWWEGISPQVGSNSRGQEEWDLHYLRIAREMSLMSKCASRQIGAIIIRDNRLVAGGYNGAPPGVSLCQFVDRPCPRRALNVSSGERLDICPAVHAETNAVATAARAGISIDGATMYAFCTVPCTTCAGVIIAAGIKRVVCLDDTIYHPLSLELFGRAGVELTHYRRKEVETHHAE